MVEKVEEEKKGEQPPDESAENNYGLDPDDPHDLHIIEMQREEEKAEAAAIKREEKDVQEALEKFLGEIWQKYGTEGATHLTKDQIR